MTKDEIIRMSREAKQYAEYVTPQGMEWFGIYNERFASLIAKQEREQCAHVCDIASLQMTTLAGWGANECAKAIRSRDNQ